MTESTKQQPAHSVLCGNVEVTAWENTNAKGQIYYKFRLTRSYKDANDQWQEHNISLSLSELSKARFALDKANRDYYILPQFRNNREPGNQTEEPLDNHS